MNFIQPDDVMLIWFYVFENQSMLTVIQYESIHSQLMRPKTWLNEMKQRASYQQSFYFWSEE